MEIDEAAAGGQAGIDDADELRFGLSRLPPRQRVAVVLRHLHGLSHEEIAAHMNCTTGTAKSHISRGLHTMRIYLSTRT